MSQVQILLHLPVADAKREVGLALFCKQKRGNYTHHPGSTNSVPMCVNLPKRITKSQLCFVLADPSVCTASGEAKTYNLRATFLTPDVVASLEIEYPPGRRPFSFQDTQKLLTFFQISLEDFNCQK